MVARRKLLLVAVNFGALSLVLLGAELLLRATGQPEPLFWGWRDRNERPDGRNQLGFRGQPIDYADGDFVVLLVGDSQVQADDCPADAMPERRLEHHLGRLLDLRVRAFSLAAAGYGQDQQLLAMEEYFARFSADLVIVWETPGNDVWNNMFPTHWPRDGWPKPTFWLDGDGALAGPNHGLGERFTSSIRIVALLQHRFGTALDQDWERRRFPPATELPRDHQGPLKTDWYYLSPDVGNFTSGKTHVLLAVRPISRRADYGMRLTNALLKRMEALANRSGARFCAFSVRRRDFPLPDGTYAIGAGPERRYVEMSRAQYNDNEARMNQGIDHFVIRVRGDDFIISYRDPHLNCRAVDQVMGDAAREVANRLE